MTRYIIRRLLQMVFVFFGATFLLFAALFILPGDPTQALGSDRNLPPATVAAIRARYHLDDPVYIQYVDYLKAIAKGDLGTSIQTKRPVRQIMAESVPWSIRLAISATAVEVLIGVVSGVISAVKRYSFMDTLVTVSTSVLVAIPVFWLGLMLQILFGLKFKGTFLGLPISGVTDGWKSYVMPSITLASAVTAVTARLTRTTMLEVMRQDYIRTASAKGLSRRAVVYKHALQHRARLRDSHWRRHPHGDGLRLARRRPADLSRHHLPRQPGHRGVDHHLHLRLHDRESRGRHFVCVPRPQDPLWLILRRCRHRTPSRRAPRR
jgi:oligopeptide transport system permease protein